MSDIYSFYSSILNIVNEDKFGIIQKTVLEEKEKLLEEVDSLEGFCIYIATQIESRLKQLGIATYNLELNDMVGVDHTILIAEYKYKDQIYRVLIDPTFEQFVKQDSRMLLKLKEWPSKKISDKEFVSSLLDTGCCIIDDDKFNMYINSFTDTEFSIDLNEYLLSKKMAKHI